MTCAVAETWAGEAAARASAAQPSHMLAAGFYEKAIQVLRSVPREFRADRNVDSKIAELHLHMDDSGKASLGEMGAISSGQMDITEIVRAAQAWVRGKSILEALAALANIHGGPKEEAHQVCRANAAELSSPGPIFDDTNVPRRQSGRQATGHGIWKFRLSRLSACALG